MADQQELAVREKRELATKEEKTVPGRFYVPYTDVYETEEALTVVMEMPGVGREDVGIELKDDVLRVEGQIDFAKYDGMEPVYTEYNVGHYARSFSLSGQGGPRAHRRAVRGRRADADAAQDRRSEAAPHRGRLSGATPTGRRLVAGRRWERPATAERRGCPRAVG